MLILGLKGLTSTPYIPVSAPNGKGSIPVIPITKISAPFSMASQDQLFAFSF